MLTKVIKVTQTAPASGCKLAMVVLLKLCTPPDVPAALIGRIMAQLVNVTKNRYPITYR